MHFILKFIAALCLCTALYSSATHYSPTLKHYFLQQELQGAYQGLWPAAKQGSIDSLDALTKLAAINQDEYWLSKAASFGNVEAMLALAEMSDKEDKVLWWQKAATLGHAPSQFELSLIENNTEQRIRYLEQAALNEYAPAIIALGKFYYDQSDIDNALRWLKKAADFDEQSRFKLAKMQWRNGDLDAATQSFELASSALTEAQTYYQVIKGTRLSNLFSLSKNKHSVGLSTDTNTSINVSTPLKEQCSQQLQFVATTLDSAVQANQFKKQFANDRRFSEFPICINPIVWLKPNELSCRIENDRQHCDFSPLAKQMFVPDYTHLVVFLDTGKAYVNNGIMYLDEADVYSVFIHELAHFAGFVDEYAVSADLAQGYCGPIRETDTSSATNNNSAPNLAISSEADLASNEQYLRWQAYNRKLNMQALNTAVVKQEASDSATLRTPSLETLPNAAVSLEDTVEADFDPIPLNVSPSRTCAKLNVDTFKPSDVLTFMEYHDAITIPPIYRLMWRQQLSQYHHQIDVAKWFANTARELGDENAADYWASLTTSL